jgi:hypothetical protein
MFDLPYLVDLHFLLPKHIWIMLQIDRNKLLVTLKYNESNPNVSEKV